MLRFLNRTATRHLLQSRPIQTRTFSPLATHVSVQSYHNDKESTYHTHRLGPETAVIINLFKAFATERSGRLGLSVIELRPLLQSIGEYPSETALHEFISTADRDQNGIITLDEFIEAYDKILFHSSCESFKDLDRILDSFNTLDTDCDGFLSKSDLEGLLSTFGQQIDSKEASEIIHAADLDGNNLIDVEEFTQLLWQQHRNPAVYCRLKSLFRLSVLVGGPACGKGTFASNLANHGHFQHLSSGDMLREEVEAKTPLGQEVEQTMARGELVGSSVIAALIRQRIATLPGSYVALDGFPRSETNVNDLVNLCGKPEVMVYLDCPEDLMIERMLSRNEGRADDNEETAIRRIQVFRSQGIPTMKYLQMIGVPLVHLDATLPPEDVWEQFCSHKDIPVVKRVNQMRNKFQ